MTFYLLTDPIRGGDIIRAEGRKHYAYSFGVCRWVRTTVMLSYMNPESPLYGQYREVPEQEAQERVIQKSVLLAGLLRKAEELATRFHAGQTDKGGRPYVEHPRAVAARLDDLEQKITAWLHDLCEDTPVTPQMLRDEGFTPRIVQAVEILTHPAGMDYFDYIRRVRPNALARAVKMADLEENMDLSRIPHPTDRDRARAEKYRAALAYLNMEAELPERAEQDGETFVPAMEVYRAVRAGALEGRKVPHGVSNPVLRRTEDGVCLAFFVYVYTKSHLDSLRMPRPSLWILADVRTGKILRRIPCGEEDFSSQPADKLYSVAYPERPAAGAGEFERLFRNLDAIRAQLCETGELDGTAYAEYLSEMLCLVPPGYRVFYKELSSV